MTETDTGTTSTTAANGAGPAPTEPAQLERETPNWGERLMFLVMLAAGAGLLFLAIDGLTGYALTRALPGRGDDDASG